MKEYTNLKEILEEVNRIIEDFGFVFDENPEIRILEEIPHMEPDSYKCFYYNIISEKFCSKFVGGRKGLWFEVTRHENGAYSLYVSYDW